MLVPTVHNHGNSQVLVSWFIFFNCFALFRLWVPPWIAPWSAGGSAGVVTAVVVEGSAGAGGPCFRIFGRISYVKFPPRIVIFHGRPWCFAGARMFLTDSCVETCRERAQASLDEIG